MSRLLVSLLLVLALAAPAPATGQTASDPHIVAVYPNPVASDDAGEFVVLEVPEETSLAGLTLGDGEFVVDLPAVSAEGRVALATEPRLVRNLTDHRVLALEGSLDLANGGERLRLARDGRVLDRFGYRDAPEGEVGRATPTGTRWRPLGATDFDVVAGGPGRVRTFVLPDAPDVPLEVLESADRRILLAGYTLTSARVADALARAAARGVSVRVLLEGGPVGGLDRREARLLDELTAAGVEVGMLTGPGERYAYHHAKYAVVDDRALVLTENWKPAGTGGRSSRGWGVVLSQPRVVARLVDLFEADAGWRDVVPWGQVRRGRSLSRSLPANGSYPRRFDPTTVRAESVHLLVAPDNAQRRLVSLLDAANESVDIVQVSIGSRDNALLSAALRAARRGVDVRILLSGAWYVREENAALVESLNERAGERGLPLEARLANPAGRFEKVHAKAVVVDGRRVALGSLNWNAQAARENREVVVVLEGAAVGSYYTRVFDADWEGRSRRLPAGLAAAALGGAVLAGLLALRIRFER